MVLGYVHNVKEKSQTGKLAEMTRDQTPKLREDVLQQTANIYSQIGVDMIRELGAAHEAETERVMKLLEESLQSDTEFVQVYAEKLWSGSEVLA